MVTPTPLPPCDWVLPGCAAERARFADDWQGGRPRCRPGSHPGAPTPPPASAAPATQVCATTEAAAALYASIEGAACCASTPQRAALNASTAWLDAVGGCPPPYATAPDWAPTAFVTHPAAVCAAFKARFEGDFGAASCVDTAADAPALHAARHRVRRTAVVMTAAGCASVPAQRRQLAADLAALGDDPDCASAVAAKAVRPAAPALLAGGRQEINASNPPMGDLVCCGESFVFDNLCCASSCHWLALYTGGIVTVEDCCMGPMVWPPVVSCDPL